MHVRQTGISRECVDGFVRNFNIKNPKTVPKSVQNFKKIGPPKRELLNFEMWLNKKDTLYLGQLGHKSVDCEGASWRVIESLQKFMILFQQKCQQL